MRDEAITVAKRASSTFLTFLGVTALAVAVAVAPADAKKVKPDNKPAEQTIADPANGEPRAGAIRGWSTAAANNAMGDGVEDDDVAFHT